MAIDMSEDDRSKKLSNAVSLMFLVVVYTGMALLFYSPEEGFTWFGNFLLLTLAVLLGFAVAVVLLAKRARKSDDAQE